LSTKIVTKNDLFQAFFSSRTKNDLFQSFTCLYFICFFSICQDFGPPMTYAQMKIRALTDGVTNFRISFVGWVKDFDFSRSEKRNPQPTLTNFLPAGRGLQPRPQCLPMTGH